jgi:hypothetical protein
MVQIGEVRMRMLHGQVLVRMRVGFFAIPREVVHVLVVLVMVMRVLMLHLFVRMDVLVAFREV